MEKVDKDIAAMITSLKKYDMLAEAFVPMSPMGRLAEKKEIDEDELNDVDSGEDNDVELNEKSKKPWEKDEEKVDEKKDKKVDEGVDPDILKWMGRFAKLGKMTGYGR